MEINTQLTTLPDLLNPHALDSLDSLFTPDSTRYLELVEVIKSRMHGYQSLLEQAHSFRMQISSEDDNILRHASHALKDTHWNDRQRVMYNDLERNRVVPYEAAPKEPVCLGSLLCETLLASDGSTRVTFEGKDEVSIDVPRCELLVWLASQLLEVNIYLFSSRKSPHVFRPPGRNAPSIGLLYVVDTIAPEAAYVPLRCHPELETTANAPERPLSSSAFNAAVYRQEARGRTSRAPAPIIPPSTLLKTIQDCSRTFIDSKITQAINEVRTSKLSDSKKKERINKAMAKTETDLQKLQRLPHSLTENVMVSLREIYELDPNDTFALLSTRTLGASTYRKANFKAENIEYFRDELQGFEKRWKEIERDLGGHEPDKSKERPKAEEQEMVRTVTVPIKAILRPDIKDAHYCRITEIMDKSQADMTHFKSELSIIQRLCLLSLADGSLLNAVDAAADGQAEESTDGQSSTASSDDAQENLPPLFNVRDILPANFVILDKEMHTMIPLAPLDPRLQQAVEDPASAGLLSELEKLFSQEHFQFLQSRHFGSRGTQDATIARHPLWEALSRTVEEAVRDNDVEFTPAPPNRSTLLSSTAKQMAVATENMWSGSLYKKSLDVIASLLDLWLRPIAEEKKRRAAIERAEAKQKKKEQEEKSPRTVRKKFKEQARQLMNELGDALRAHDPDKVQDRLCKLDAKICCVPPRQVQRNREPLEPVQVDWTLGSVTLVNTKGKQKRTGEPSIHAVKVLKGVFKMLIQSPAIHEDVDGNWVRKCIDDPEKLDIEMSEYQKVAQLVNIVRPFVPKRHINTSYSPSPVLCAPVVLLADTVLRLTGRHSKTRVWSPNVVGSDLHAIHVTPSALLQILCSNHPEQFDVKDNHGRCLALTSINRMENKQLLFGAFFDLAKIEQLCHQHGLRFRFAFMYVDSNMVRLEGDVLKHGDDRNGHPVVDHIDVRKKSQRTKKHSKDECDKKDEKGKKRQRDEDEGHDEAQSFTGDQGSGEETHPKMSKEQLASELSAVRDQLAAMADEVRQSNAELARLEGARNFSRNMFDRAKRAKQDTIELWAKLSEARRAVDNHRQSKKTMMDLYTTRKEEAWVLQQELNAVKQAERRARGKHSRTTHPLTLAPHLLEISLRA